MKAYTKNKLMLERDKERVFTIDDLYASAYENAINNVIGVLNESLGTKYFFSRDCYVIDTIAEKLNIKFDVDGEIIS